MKILTSKLVHDLEDVFNLNCALITSPMSDLEESGQYVEAGLVTGNDNGQERYVGTHLTAENGRRFVLKLTELR